MASPKVKATYSLDVETVEALERTARRWNVSRSEALRRAVRAAAAEAGTGPAEGAVAALTELQRALDLTDSKAKSWASDSRRERRASSERLER